MVMEHGPFENVFAIENGDIPASYVSLPEGIDAFSLSPGISFSFRSAALANGQRYEPDGRPVKHQIERNKLHSHYFTLVNT